MTQQHKLELVIEPAEDQPGEWRVTVRSDLYDGNMRVFHRQASTVEFATGFAIGMIRIEVDHWKERQAGARLASAPEEET